MAVSRFFILNLLPESRARRIVYPPRKLFASNPETRALFKAISHLHYLPSQTQITSSAMLHGSTEVFQQTRQQKVFLSNSLSSSNLRTHLLPPRLPRLFQFQIGIAERNLCEGRYYSSAGNSSFSSRKCSPVPNESSSKNSIIPAAATHRSHARVRPSVIFFSPTVLPFVDRVTGRPCQIAVETSVTSESAKIRVRTFLSSFLRCSFGPRDIQRHRPLFDSVLEHASHA